MSRTLTMNWHGGFEVSDDPNGVITTALVVATNPDNLPRIDVELSPKGDCLHVESVGTIYRVRSRAELPHPYNEDPSLDPETQELWALFREPDRPTYPPSGRFVIQGDELRELVSLAVVLREARWPAAKSPAPSPAAPSKRTSWLKRIFWKPLLIANHAAGRSDARPHSRQRAARPREGVLFGEPEWCPPVARALPSV